MVDKRVTTKENNMSFILPGLIIGTAIVSPLWALMSMMGY